MTDTASSGYDPNATTIFNHGRKYHVIMINVNSTMTIDADSTVDRHDYGTFKNQHDCVKFKECMKQPYEKAQNYHPDHKHYEPPKYLWRKIERRK